MTEFFVGKRYGRLTVTAEPLLDQRVPCRCDCGSVRMPYKSKLRHGQTLSCGCLRAERQIVAVTKHGLSKRLAYSSWKSMLSRCKSERTMYGRLGVSVCERWQNFHNFLADMGDRPNGMTLERIDTNGHYEPGNCKWATCTEQSENRTISRYWTIDGVTYKSSRAAAKALGIRPDAVIKKCRGYTYKGKTYPPVPGWSSQPRYAIRAIKSK